jgi:hypothetical protein
MTNRQFLAGFPSPYHMTTKTSGPIAATRQKILAQISAAQKKAGAAKKAARTAKAGFKQARQKFKEARRAAKAAKKAVKVLKTALTATAVVKARPKPAVTKARVKRLPPPSAPVVAREPAVAVSPTTDSVPPIVSNV